MYFGLKPLARLEPHYSRLVKLNSYKNLERPSALLAANVDDISLL